MDRVSASQYYRQHLSGLTPLQRHTQLLQHALQGGQHSSSSDAAGLLQATETDYDALRKHHRFLRGPEDDAAVQEAASSWGVRLAKRYYARLFKEYAIADLSRYKESKVGLRWRTQAEVVSGKGQFSCGAKGCDSSSGLAAYEVNFAYQEAGQAKQALVKLCLCEDCAVKLNYRRERGQQYKRLGGMGVGMAGERQREERGGRDRDRRDRERAGKRQLEDGGLDLREAQWREKRHKESYSGREGAGELLPPPPQQQQQRDGRRQQHSGCGSPGRRERQLAEHLARPAELQPQRECREPRSLDGGGDVGGGGSRVQEHQRASSSREGGREGRSKAPGESDRRDDGGGRRAGSSRSQGRVEQQQQQGAADSRLPLPPLKNSSSRAESELQLQRAPVGSAAGGGGGGGDVSGGASSRGVSKTQSVSDDRWQLDGDGGGGGCTAAEAALAEGDGVGDTGVGDTCRWELEDGELNEVDIERWLDSLFTVAPGV